MTINDQSQSDDTIEEAFVDTLTADDWRFLARVYEATAQRITNALEFTRVESLAADDGTFDPGKVRAFVAGFMRPAAQSEVEAEREANR